MSFEGQTVVTRRLCVATGEILDGSIEIPEHLVAGGFARFSDAQRIANVDSRLNKTTAIADRVQNSYGLHRSIIKRLIIIFEFCEKNLGKTIEMKTNELALIFNKYDEFQSELNDRLITKLTSGRGVQKGNGYVHHYKINTENYEHVKEEYREIYDALYK